MQLGRSAEGRCWVVTNIRGWWPGKREVAPALLAATSTSLGQQAVVVEHGRRRAVQRTLVKNLCTWRNKGDHCRYWNRHGVPGPHCPAAAAGDSGPGYYNLSRAAGQSSIAGRLIQHDSRRYLPGCSLAGLLPRPGIARARRDGGRLARSATGPGELAERIADGRFGNCGQSFSHVAGPDLADGWPSTASGSPRQSPAGRPCSEAKLAGPGRSAWAKNGAVGYSGHRAGAGGETHSPMFLRSAGDGNETLAMRGEVGANSGRGTWESSSSRS